MEIDKKIDSEKSWLWDCILVNQDPLYSKEWAILLGFTGDQCCDPYFFLSKVVNQDVRRVKAAMFNPKEGKIIKISFTVIDHLYQPIGLQIQGCIRSINHLTLGYGTISFVNKKRGHWLKFRRNLRVELRKEINKYLDRDRDLKSGEGHLTSATESISDSQNHAAILEQAAQLAQLGIVKFDPVNHKASYNDKVLEIYETTLEEIKDNREFWRGLVVEEDKPVTFYHMDKLFLGISKEINLRFRIKTRSGALKHIFFAGVSMLDRKGRASYIVGIHVDISVLAKSANELENALEAKRNLLKELHHRVKNNFQLISSLLYLNSRNQTDPQNIALIDDIEGKIFLIAQIHERLLEVEQMDSIHSKDFFEEIIAKVNDDNDLQLMYGIKDYQISSDSALCSGLVIHEMLSWIKMYAKDHLQEKLQVLICFSAEPNGQYFLEISDTSGKVNVEDVSKVPEFDLIRAFSSQIGGNCSIANGDGLNMRLTFP